jgi:hypothetical protein
MICHCPKSDFLCLMTKSNCCFVLDNVLRLSKILEKNSLFGWRDPIGLAREIYKRNRTKNYSKGQ